MRPLPRLHVVTATSSPLAVVLRRGPSRVVASLGWNRATGELTQGQWFGGRIHEHRCDLSPDGRLFVYFASRGGGHAWTAVSRAPWLRAILYRPQTSTWCGGGALDEAGRLWLNGGRIEPGEHPEIVPAPADAYPHSTDGFHTGGTYPAMQERRGWQRIGGEGYGAMLRRGLPEGWNLELSFVLRARNRSAISTRYALLAPDGTMLEQPDWEWADLFGDRLLVAARGALWDLAAAAPAGPWRKLHDLMGMAFERVIAPYDDRAPKAATGKRPVAVP